MWGSLPNLTKGDNKQTKESLGQLTDLEQHMLTCYYFWMWRSTQISITKRDRDRQGRTKTLPFLQVQFWPSTQQTSIYRYLSVITRTSKYVMVELYPCIELGLVRGWDDTLTLFKVFLVSLGCIWYFIVMFIFQELDTLSFIFLQNSFRNPDNSYNINNQVVSLIYCRLLTSSLSLSLSLSLWVFHLTFKFWLLIAAW